MFEDFRFIAKTNTTWRNGLALALCLVGVSLPLAALCVTGNLSALGFAVIPAVATFLMAYGLWVPSGADADVRDQYNRLIRHNRRAMGMAGEVN